MSTTTTHLYDIARTLSIDPAELALGRQFNNVECPLCGMDTLSAINRNGKLLVKCHGPDGCDGVDILAELVPAQDATEYEFYAFRSAMSRGVWVLPMDGQTVWPRTSIEGKPAVYVTRDAGASWRRLDRGLPSSQAWLTVLRQAMCTDGEARPALYFGTTGGEVWVGGNGGASWRCIAHHLPEIYSVNHAT